jgi:RNA polymerase sigma-70 factor (ECF subfamily)
LGIEESLVLEVQRGDLNAFSGIYEAYYDRVFRYILVRLHNQAEAEDLASEVFLKALQAVGEYKLKGVSFAAWLFRIAHNLIIDHVRRRNKRPTTELDDTLPLTQDSPDELVLLGLTSEAVKKAMTELTDSQRQVIALRFGGGLSLAETAEAMGKKEGAIKAMQFSAIQALRRILAREGHDVPGVEK